MGEPPRRLTTLADEHNDQRNDEVLGARFMWCSLLIRQNFVYNPNTTGTRKLHTAHSTVTQARAMQLQWLVLALVAQPVAPPRPQCRDHNLCMRRRHTTGAAGGKEAMAPLPAAGVLRRA